jgi:hypothetical protein
MSQITELASGQITPSEAITVELVARDSMPAIVKITWPLQPTVCDPRRFPDIAGTIARLFAKASTELTRLRGHRLR